MMNLQNILDQIQDRLPNCTVELKNITKNNDTNNTAIIISEDGYAISPVIYIDEMIDQLSEDEIVKNVLLIYSAERPDELSLVDKITDFNYAKDILYVQLVNYENNKEYLRDKIGIKFLDLFILPILSVEMSGKQATIKINKNMVKSWKKTEDEVIKAAINNTINADTEVRNIIEFFPNGLLDCDYCKDVEAQMYVIRTTNYMYGASKMLDLQAFNKISDLFGCDILTIPSSIYELILLPCNDYNLSSIDEMIVEVNNSVLESTDILSNHYYIYSKERGWTY